MISRVISTDTNEKKSYLRKLYKRADGKSVHGFRDGFHGDGRLRMGHTLISDNAYSSIKAKCDFSHVNQTKDCISVFDEYSKLYKMIDIYSLYSSTCPLGRPFAANRLLNTRAEVDAPDYHLVVALFFLNFLSLHFFLI